MMTLKPTIIIVSPCYNEEQIIDYTSLELTKKIKELIDEDLISSSSFIAFVDDGSRDNTWKKIEELSSKNPFIKGLKLAGNVGHQNALYAGLMYYKTQGDALISIDADLQDDINVIKEMVVKFTQGNEIVYGVRKERKTDTFFKRVTAQLFYKFMLFMKVNIVYNHADFRLCSKRVLNGLEQYEEVNLFLRGIISDIGFNSDIVYYDRLERKAGESKYPLKKMISLAWNGITSFSNYPLKLVTTIGFCIFLGCILMTIYALISWQMHQTIPGWLSTVLPMYFLGGIQLFCFGIIGEYIGKIFSEVKKRPRYIIDKETDKNYEI